MYIQQFKYPLALITFSNSVFKSYGSCFPVAPNIILTARHAVYDSKFIDAGYKVSYSFHELIKMFLVCLAQILKHLTDLSDLVPTSVLS